MYRRIVERQVRGTFAQINAGNYTAMLDTLAPEFEYHFIGDHPLGGRRTRLDTMDRWWQRVMRLIPDINFQVHEVIVRGHPLNTRIAVRSTVSGHSPTGAPYRNEMMQFMHLRLGKLTRVESMEDTALLLTFLFDLDPADYPEAAAPPLVDGDDHRTADQHVVHE
ncbi:MAG: nuclear transport factor 2 family protein [Acidimicrobiales bacterium]